MVCFLHESGGRARWRHRGVGQRSFSSEGIGQTSCSSDLAPQAPLFLVFDDWNFSGWFRRDLCNVGPIQDGLVFQARGDELT